MILHPTYGSRCCHGKCNAQDNVLNIIALVPVLSYDSFPVIEVWSHTDLHISLINILYLIIIYIHSLTEFPGFMYSC